MGEVESWRIGEFLKLIPGVAFVDVARAHVVQRFLALRSRRGAGLKACTTYVPDSGSKSTTRPRFPWCNVNRQPRHKNPQPLTHQFTNSPIHRCDTRRVRLWLAAARA